MRTISYTNKFKRDYRREQSGALGPKLERLLRPVLAMLADDTPLAAACRDHALTGDWKDHRDCHIKPDLVLIYRKTGDDGLELVRLGSHSELGL